jgi:hypothetical protein
MLKMEADHLQDIGRDMHMIVEADNARSISGGICAIFIGGNVFL